MTLRKVTVMWSSQQTGGGGGSQTPVNAIIAPHTSASWVRIPGFNAGLALGASVTEVYRAWQPTYTQSQHRAGAKPKCATLHQLR